MLSLIRFKNYLAEQDHFLKHCLQYLLKMEGKRCSANESSLIPQHGTGSFLFRQHLLEKMDNIKSGKQSNLCPYPFTVGTGSIAPEVQLTGPFRPNLKRKREDDEESIDSNSDEKRARVTSEDKENIDPNLSENRERFMAIEKILDSLNLSQYSLNLSCSDTSMDDSLEEPQITVLATLGELDSKDKAAMKYIPGYDSLNAAMESIIASHNDTVRIF